MKPNSNPIDEDLAFSLTFRPCDNNQQQKEHEKMDKDKKS